MYGNWVRSRCALRYTRPQARLNTATAGDHPTEHAMKTIVFATQKGGAGKTTLSCHVAVELNRLDRRVALVDADPQGSSTTWWNLRESDEPTLISADPNDLGKTTRDIQDEVDFVIVDTPPFDGPMIGRIARVADLIVIPCRPGVHDIYGMQPTLEMAHKQGIPFVFVLNAVTPNSRVTKESAVALSQHGRLAAIINNRVLYSESATNGLTAQEESPKGPAATEIRTLTEYLISEVSK